MFFFETAKQREECKSNVDDGEGKKTINGKAFEKRLSGILFYKSTASASGQNPLVRFACKCVYGSLTRTCGTQTKWVNGPVKSINEFFVIIFCFVFFSSNLRNALWHTDAHRVFRLPSARCHKNAS